MYVIHDREQYKSGRTDQDAVWGMNLGGGQRTLLYGVHIGTKWRIRLNDQCAATMRFMSKLLYYSNKRLLLLFAKPAVTFPASKRYQPILFLFAGQMNMHICKRLA